VTDGEDHEPVTSPITDPANCMGLIEDEQDSGIEAWVTTLDNVTEPSTSGSNPGLPSGKLNRFVSAITLILYYKLDHCVDSWEDHEPITSPLPDPAYCMGVIQDELDSGSEACVSTLDNGTGPSTSGSNPGLPSGKLTRFVYAFTLPLHYKLDHWGDRWRRS